MIKKDKDSFVLKLNSALYDNESVKEAFDELKKHANAVCENGEYFTVKIKGTTEAEKYGYEFLNYVLKLMKNKGAE